jgi:peptidoglycan/LPS O-acetylase OafA/YrhL
MNVSKGLTSFRALAFFAIFFFHTTFMTTNHFGFKGGYLGIQAFFVLSGFLLTPILVGMKSNLNKKDFFIHFYGRRILRIFPLYYSYIAIVASLSFWAVYRHGHNTETDRFIEQLPWLLTFTYDFFHVSNYFQNSVLATHFWSLAVEEQFYLVWPLAIFFIQTNHLKRFLLLVVIAGPLMRYLLAIIYNADIIPNNQTLDLVIYVLPFSHFDAFAVGGYFALYGKSRSSYLVWAFILFVLLLGIITSWLSARQVYLGQLGYGPFMKDSYKYVWGYSVLDLMFAYILVHVKNKSFMPALFENPLLVYLGSISYGLYVFHLPMLWLVYAPMYNFPEVVRASTTLLITALISMASYELMEKRFINLKDKYFSRASADNNST